MSETSEAESVADLDLTVVERVLRAFVEAVANESDCVEIADRLKTTLLEKHDFGEAALERALFGAEQS
jgi:hypothetical protein